jgi:iron complex outermembrane receptor protein
MEREGLMTAGRTPRVAWRLLLVLLLVVGLPLTAAAQNTGRITGVVTDATGGVLPGVTVTIKAGTAAAQTTVTDANGRYAFDKLAPGSYEVSFELSGFAKQTSTAAVVAGQPFTLDPKLQVGGQAEAIQVTGTLIPRPSLEAMSPVSTLEPEELTYRGLTRVEDLLTSLPQVFVAQNSSVSNGASGTATVDLRYLGTVRTLVLLDGRRMPNGDAQIYGADLNFIPSALVKRVDVLTGGASSTYGADAVAGVVNFVLDRDFTGFKGGVQWSTYQHNNSNDLAQSINKARGFPYPTGSVWNSGPQNWNMAFGSKLADGKGHASFYLDYRKTDAITKDQRDYTNCSVLGGMTMNGPTCGGSSTSPTGRFYVNSGPSYTVDPASGNMVPWASKYAFNYAPYNFMQRPDIRWAGGAFINYEWNKHFKVYGDVMFMDDTTDAQIAPSGDFGNSLLLNCDNPFLTAQQRQILCTNEGYGPTDIANVQILRRNVEGGGRIAHINHTDLRYTGGLKGEINKAFTYDVYGMQASVRSPQSYSNDLNVTRIQNALFVTNTPTGPACTTDTENGCVPWNIFQPGGVTAGALSYLALDEVMDTGTRTRVIEATVSGDLKQYNLAMPWATEGMKVAFGGGWRDEFLFIHPDYPYQAALGAGSGGPTLPVEGTYSVKEFFAEGLIPFVQDKRGAKDLSLEAGYRLSNYSTTGTHSTYKVQGSWAPVAALKFRAGYNRATRSPNIVELFTAQGIGLGGSQDLCAGIISLGQVPTASQAQCVQMGVPASAYGTISPNSAQQYNTLGGGNPNLAPETADTYTAGGVLNYKRLGFTVDYYDVKINGTIGSLGSTDIQNTCANSGQLCNLIHRDQFYSTWRTNQGYVFTSNANVGVLQSRGLDITGSYTVPLGQDKGALSVNLIGTYLLKQYINTGLYDYDCVGFFGNTCGNPTPTWRHLARFSWEIKKFALTAGWRMLGSVDIDESSTNPNLGVTGSGRTAQLALDAANNILTIPAYNYMDLGVTYKVKKLATLVFGVNNVFDKEPPLAPGQSNNDYGTGFYNTYDSLGRYIHAGVQFQF